MDLLVNLDGLCVLVAHQVGAQKKHTLMALLLDARGTPARHEHGGHAAHPQGEASATPPHVPHLRYGDGLHRAYGIVQETAFPLYQLSRQEITFEAPGAESGVENLADLEKHLVKLPEPLPPAYLEDPPPASVVARVVFNTGRLLCKDFLDGDLVDPTGKPLRNSQRRYAGRVDIHLHSSRDIKVVARPFSDATPGGAWRLPLVGRKRQALKVGNLPWDALWSAPLASSLAEPDNGASVDRHFTSYYELLGQAHGTGPVPRVLPAPRDAAAPTRANPWCLMAYASL